MAETQISKPYFCLNILFNQYYSVSNLTVNNTNPIAVMNVFIHSSNLQYYYCTIEGYYFICWVVLLVTKQTSSMCLRQFDLFNSNQTSVQYPV